MITTVIALLVGIQGPAATKVSAAGIMTKMFAHYADAKSVVGTIKMTLTAAGESLHTNTNVQFDRPSKIFLHQTRDGLHPREWLLVSDAKSFSYDPPNEQSKIFGQKRHVEYVTQHGTSQNLGDFLSAAAQSLGDINPMIEAMISSKVWLQKLTGQWATLVYRGKVTANGQECHAITGNYRDNVSAPPSGTFEAYVTEDGEFVKYVLHQRVSVANGVRDPVDVTTTWDAVLKIDAPSDPALYSVLP